MYDGAMKRRVFFGTLALAIGIILAWVLANKLLVGKGYAVWGQGVEIQDRETLAQMITAGREAAGFYQPFVIMRVREGLHEPNYALYTIDMQTKEPITGCLTPKAYLARGISIVTIDSDYNKIIVAYGEQKAGGVLNGIVANCLAFGIASGDSGETGHTQVWESMQSVMGTTQVFGAGL